MTRSAANAPKSWSTFAPQARRPDSRKKNGKKHASRNIHDAGTPAGALVYRHTRRGHREIAVGRSARLYRIVAGRTFFGNERADPLADDVHGKPDAPGQIALRDRGHLCSHPR